jgi:hypothetical protein
MREKLIGQIVLVSKPDTLELPNAALPEQWALKAHRPPRKLEGRPPCRPHYAEEELSVSKNPGSHRQSLSSYGDSNGIVQRRRCLNQERERALIAIGLKTTYSDRTSVILN